MFYLCLFCIGSLITNAQLFWGQSHSNVMTSFSQMALNSVKPAQDQSILDTIIKDWRYFE